MDAPCSRRGCTEADAGRDMSRPYSDAETAVELVGVRRGLKPHG